MNFLGFLLINQYINQGHVKYSEHGFHHHDTQWIVVWFDFMA